VTHVHCKGIANEHTVWDTTRAPHKFNYDPFEGPKSIVTTALRGHLDQLQIGLFRPMTGRNITTDHGRGGCPRHA